MRIIGSRQQMETMVEAPTGRKAGQPGQRTRLRAGTRRSQPGGRRKLSSATAGEPPRQRGARRKQGAHALLQAVTPHLASSPLHRQVSHPPATHGAGDAGLHRLRARLMREHPVLRTEARRLIEERLQQQHGLRLDADKTYFNTFSGGHSSSRTYNGWEHSSAPLSSMSLTDLQMRNFDAHLGEDPTELDALAGIYAEGAGTNRFGVHNEVRLLASDLKQAIRQDDLYTHYRAQLQAYWDKNRDAVGRIYGKLARLGLRHAGLSREGQAMLRAVLRQARNGDTRGLVAAYAFDIDSYPSKDMTWLESNGHVLLMMPGNRRPLREYASVDAMRAGIEQMARTAMGRKELSLHFSLYNRDDGVTYQGVDKWLEDIGRDGYRARIAYAPKKVEGNVFLDMATRTRDAELDDVKRLVRSNGEVDEEECTQFVHVLAFMVPWLFLPAKVAETGLNLHQAITAGAASGRRAAARRALVNFGELALALVPGLRLKRGPGSVVAAAGERGVFFKAPGRTADGRIGYVLGPLQAPHPRDLIQEAFDEAAADGTLNEIDWNDPGSDGSLAGSRSASPQSGRLTPSSPSSPASSASPSPPSSPASAPRFPSSVSRSPTPGTSRAGSWRPGQDIVHGSQAEPIAGTSSMQAGTTPRLRINELGWLEHLDLPQVYRAEPIGNLAVQSPEVHGFTADMHLEGNGLTARNRFLHTTLTEASARAYGDQVYGAGNFALYRIDTLGQPAVSFRSSVNYDMWTAGVLVEPQRPLTPDVPDVSFPPAQPGAAGEVHLPARAAGSPGSSASSGSPVPGPSATARAASEPLPGTAVPPGPHSLIPAPASSAGTEIPDGFEVLSEQEQDGYDRGDVFLDIRRLPLQSIHRIS